MHICFDCDDDTSITFHTPLFVAVVPKLRTSFALASRGMMTLHLVRDLLFFRYMFDIYF